MKYISLLKFPAYIPGLFLFILITACNENQQTGAIDMDDTISDIELTQQKPQHQYSNSLIFGFDLRSSPQEDARQYLPFLRYLEQTTNYHFDLQFTPSHSSIVDELGKNRIHFAAVGAESFINAQEKYKALSLVRGINTQGKSEYQSIIVVHPESKIKTIQELKGKHFAFGNFNSTQGHLIPRIILLKNALRLNDFAGYEYTGSHLNCVNSVISKKFDACGMQDTMAREMASQGLVRILHISPYYPSSGIAANKNIKPEILAKVQQALLKFDPKGKHKQSLYNWHKTEMPNGFVKANIQDYAELRKWSIKLGLLKPTEATKQDQE